MSAKVVSGKVVFMLCVCLMFGISTFFKGKLAANFAPALRNIWLQRTCSIKVTLQFVSCDQITKNVLFRPRTASPTPKRQHRPRTDSATAQLALSHAACRDCTVAIVLIRKQA